MASGLGQGKGLLNAPEQPPSATAQTRKRASEMYRISDLVSAGGGRPALHGERDRARSVAAIASSGVAYHQPTFRLVYCTTRGGTLENNELSPSAILGWGKSPL